RSSPQCYRSRVGMLTIICLDTYAVGKGRDLYLHYDWPPDLDRHLLIHSHNRLFPESFGDV
ncbi:MAG: hypothetical protein WCP66_03165, partial [Methylococcales bacterium]